MRTAYMICKHANVRTEQLSLRARAQRAGCHKFSVLHGDAWNSVPQQYRLNIERIRNESQVVNPSRVFFFSEENSWPVQELGSVPINDNNLRATPGTGDDHFGTFHDAPSRDLDTGYAFAVFVDAHVERVSAYPVGNSFVLSWPGGPPVPDF